MSPTIGAPGGCQHRSRAQGRGLRVACGGRARRGWHEPARCRGCRLLWGRIRTRALRGRGAPAHPAGVRPPQGCGRAVQSDRRARPGARDRCAGQKACRGAAGRPAGPRAGHGRRARLCGPLGPSARGGAAWCYDATSPTDPAPAARASVRTGAGTAPVMPWPIQPPRPTRKGEAHASRGDRAAWPDPWSSTLAAQGPCFHRGARPAGGRNG